MEIRKLIQKDLEDLLNTNAQGIEFILGEPAVTYNSLFALQRFGDPSTNPNEEWYEVITEEFLPVVVNSFDAVFISQPKIRGFSATMSISFLIPFEDQTLALAAIEGFVNKLPGRVETIDNNYYVSYNSSFPTFAETQVYNEIRFIQYNVRLGIMALQDTFSLQNIKIEISNSNLNNGEFVELPILAYVPNRMRETTVVQKINTNAVLSLAKNSAWAANIGFFLSISSDDNNELKNITAKMLQVLEDSSQEQNELYILRITYEPLDYVIEKNVIITGIQTNFTREDMASITIMFEEAYSEVI